MSPPRSFPVIAATGSTTPKPIPDLGGPKARLKIDQSPDAKALEPFIHGLVTQEFDGAEPLPGVLAGLARASDLLLAFDFVLTSY